MIVHPLGSASRLQTLHVQCSVACWLHKSIIKDNHGDTSTTVLSLRWYWLHPALAKISQGSAGENLSKLSSHRVPNFWFCATKKSADQTRKYKCKWFQWIAFLPRVFRFDHEQKSLDIGGCVFSRKKNSYFGDVRSELRLRRDLVGPRKYLLDRASTDPCTRKPLAALWIRRQECENSPGGSKSNNTEHTCWFPG